jgi:hypothetical protein
MGTFKKIIEMNKRIYKQKNWYFIPVFFAFDHKFYLTLDLNNNILKSKLGIKTKKEKGG